MGKGSNKQRKSAHKSTKVQSNDNVFREEDLDDEIDAFHKQRDVISLDINDDDADSDEEMEQAVFDLEDGGEDSDDSKGDEDDKDNDNDIVDEDIRPRGFAAKIARQAKYLQQKFGGPDDEVDDGNDDEKEEEENKSVWGRKKDFYYGSDSGDEDEESDEDLALEEAEALKMQKETAKSLSMEDFGLGDVGGADNDSAELNKTFQDTFAGKKAAQKHNVDALLEDSPLESYEVVKKDLSALSRQEQMEVVKSSAPEVLGLLVELDKARSQLKQLKPLLAEAMKEKKDTIKGAMGYLEVNQILLLTYCQAITFSLLLKSEGHSIRDHPVVARLIEIKNLLERMEQIGEDIPSQVEESAKINTDARVVHDQESVPMDFEPKMKDDSIKQHHITAVKESQLVKDSSSKDLVSNNIQDAHVGLQSMKMLKIRANLVAKLKKKGIYNSLNSNPGRAQHHAQMLANQRLETLDDFDDEVQQTAKGKHESNDNTTLLHMSKHSQLVATKVKKQKIISGDDDLPKRDDIGERRRKYELRVLARTGTKSVDDGGNDDMEDEEDLEEAMATGIPAEDGESEDEFYKQVKKQRADKLKAKEQLYIRAPASLNPPLELDADGKRHITVQMEKNRGLTRSRKKLTKNPRKKYRINHQKAVMKRKGQVRDIRKPTASYGGEATGININVSRSRRFNS